MRIVVATPYKIANYGAMLQAWALKTKLERLGHSVCYLNCRYLWPGVWPVSRLLRSRSIAGFFSKIQMNKMMRRCIKDLGTLPETRAYDSADELVADPPDCDCMISGSDQIFHELYFSNRNRYIPVLLGFGSPKIKKFVYGASFGTNEANFIVPDAVKEMLLEIKSISVRETSGCRILKQKFGIDGFWVPDPTFLLEESDYVDFFHLTKLSKQKYIAVYTLGFDRLRKLRDSTIAKVKRIYGCEEVHILSAGISLSGWLNEIRNATCVVTNSFHGHCFARLFDVPYELLEFDGKDSWRNERNRDLEGVLKQKSIDELREIGCSMLQRFLSQA